MRNTTLIQLLDHTAQNNLEDIIRRQILVRAHGRRIDNIARLGGLVQLIIQVLERIADRRVVAELQQLNTELMGGCLQLIEHLCRINQRGLDVVVKLARREHNQVPPSKVILLLDLVAVPPQQLAQARTQIAFPLGFHMGEDLSDAVPRLQLGEAANAAVARLADRLPREELDETLGAVVDKVNVDAVWVVLGAHRGNVVDELLDLVPVGGHGRTVVDDEDGLEGAEVGELGIVLARVDAAGSGAWKVGRHCDCITMYVVRRRSVQILSRWDDEMGRDEMKLVMFSGWWWVVVVGLASFAVRCKVLSDGLLFVLFSPRK